MFLRHFADRKVGIPYGVALGVGGLVSLSRTRRWWYGRSSAFPHIDPEQSIDAPDRGKRRASQAAIRPFPAG